MNLAYLRITMNFLKIFNFFFDGDFKFDLLLDAIPSTTFVAFTNGMPVLGPNPCTTFCMSCRKTVQTLVSVEDGSPPLAWLAGGLLCLMG